MASYAYNQPPRRRPASKGAAATVFSIFGGIVAVVGSVGVTVATCGAATPFVVGAWSGVAAVGGGVALGGTIASAQNEK